MSAALRKQKSFLAHDITVEIKKGVKFISDSESVQLHFHVVETTGSDKKN